MSSTMANAGKELEEKLQQLQGLLAAEGIEPQQYAETVTALEALNAEVKTYYGPRGADGRRKPLNEENRTQLIGLYETALSRCTAFAAAQQGNIKALTQSIGMLLAGDLNAVRQADPQTGISLPLAIQEGRTMHVQLGGEQVKAMSGLLSSRIPLSITDESGQVLNGFFTKNTIVDPLSNFIRFLNENPEKAPHAAEGFFIAYHNFEADLREKGLQYDQVQLNDLFLQEMDRLVAENTKPGENLPASQKLNLLWQHWAPDYCKEHEAELKEEFSKLIKPFAATVSQRRLYQKNLGAKPGDNIDTRNVAMSDLAALLGVSELISYSRPVSVTMDGKTVSGTFMAHAHGVDRAHVPGIDHPLNRRTVEEQITDFGMMSVADLAVVDYLSNNLDRHVGNMFYQYDEEGRFIGVEGIDNDASWGVSDNMGAYGCKPEKLGVITKRMADRVAALDPAMLEYMLRARGLKEDQISGAAMRLANLKQAILEKKVEVLDESAFMERLRSQGADFCKGKGYFDRVRNSLDMIQGKSKEIAANAGAKPIDRRSGRQELSDGTEHDTELLQTLYQSLQEQQAALEKTDRWWIISSKNFRNMKKALKETCQLAGECLNDPKNRVGYVRLAVSLQNLKAMTDKYVTGTQKSTSRNSYVESRLNCARGLQSVVASQQTALQDRQTTVRALQQVREDRTVIRYEREMEKIRRMEQLAREAGFGDAPDAETDAQRVGKGIRDILQTALSGPADAPSHVNAMQLLIRGFKMLKEMPDGNGLADSGLKKTDIANAQKIIQWGRAVEGKKKPAPQAEVELMREAESVITL